RAHEDLGTLRETIAERGFVEAALGIVTQVYHAAAHAGADPAPGIAEHHGLAAGHVLEREPAQVTAEHELGAGKPDGGARIRTTLDEEPPALRTVREAFADGSVHESAGRVARFEDGHRTAERGLGGAVLRAAAQHEV